MAPISHPDMLAKLTGVTEVTERRELRDDAGKLIGYFDPAPIRDETPGGWGAFTAEEVARAIAAKAGRSGPGRTLDEIDKEFGHP